MFVLRLWSEDDILLSTKSQISRTALIVGDRQEDRVVSGLDIVTAW